MWVPQVPADSLAALAHKDPLDHKDHKDHRAK